MKKPTSLSLEFAFATLLCFAVFVVASYPVVNASWYGVSQFQDDSFYYFVTAKNFLRHGSFAFDGVNSTNGFQPLWMGAITLLLLGVGVDATLNAQVFAINVLEQLVLGAAIGTSIYFYAQSRRHGQPWALGYLAVPVLLLCPFYVIFEQGMETTLAVLIILIVIYAFLTDRLLLLGGSLALLFLARLDTAVFVAAPLLLWSLATKEGGAKARWYAVSLFVITFGIYVAVNLIRTGHAVPISGVVKSSFPALRWQAAFFTEPITLARMFGWSSLVRGINVVECTALGLAGLVLLAMARPEKGVRNKLLMLALITALLVGNLLSFQKWDKSIDPRYLALPMTVATIFVATCMFLALERTRQWLVGFFGRDPGNLQPDWPSTGALISGALCRVAPYALIVGLLLWEGATHLSRFRAYADRTSDPIQEIFREIDRVLPRDAVVAGTDVGALAFWTQRRVINLDGVINNFAYQECLRNGGLREYLRREGVTHLATALWDREQSYTGRPIERMYRQVLDPRAVHGVDYEQHEFFVYSYLYGVYSDKITLRPIDEVYRKFLGKDGIADAAYVIYRLPD